MSPRIPKENNKIISATFLRYLVNFWTLLFYVLIVLDFIKENSLADFIGPVAAIYVSILTVYSAEKEFERWHDYNIGRHPGEIYVITWTILILALLIPEFLLRTSYHIPSEVFSTYVVVIGILAITKKSKSNYNRGKRK
jgi:hypothetical protein